MNENSERLLQQRITVRMVPVTKALGSYNSNTFDFWVYGDDRRCYAPNYPAQCCCGCSVYWCVCWKWVVSVEVVCLEGGDVMVMKGVLFNELEVCMVLMKGV